MVSEITVHKSAEATNVVQLTHGLPSRQIALAPSSVPHKPGAG